MEAARRVGGIVALREVLDGSENVRVEAVATDTDDLARIADGLDDVGLEVLDTKLIEDTHTQPLRCFADGVDDAP